MTALIRQYGFQAVVVVLGLTAGVHFLGVLVLALALMGVVGYVTALRWGAVIGCCVAGLMLLLMVLIRSSGF